ncbi:hypothetical protein F4805DRAFT_459525 [Annulohypoxylon moriforme]|nr:hypothetical protein F4805DRAFT_459525 [Annulohypoxylon moriforme]
MCFSDSNNEREEIQYPAIPVVREPQRSTQGYVQRPQTAYHGMGGYGYPQNLRAGDSYARPKTSHTNSSNDPRAAWGSQHNQQYSQPRPYAQLYARQEPHNYPPQQGPRYNQGEGQQRFRPYRPDPLEKTNMQKVLVSRPKVTPGSTQERHQSVHGEIGYAQPASAAHQNTSQRGYPAGIKPASRPMNPTLTPSKSRPGKLVRRDSNGVSECSSDDDYAVDLRSYTVSPDISRGRPNRHRGSNRH